MLKIALFHWSQRRLAGDKLAASKMKYPQQNDHMGPRVKLQINNEIIWCDNSPKQHS